jgi:hypothetical protein
MAQLAFTVPRLIGEDVTQVGVWLGGIVEGPPLDFKGGHGKAEEHDTC